MNAATDGLPSKWFDGLRARVIILLSLVALPIGMIAIYQTNRLAETADKNAELALLALSDQAVQAERLVIQRALGAADMLGNIAPMLLANPDRCVPVLQDFLDDQPNFSFVGILPLSGIMTCSSTDAELDFSDYPSWDDLIANPRPSVVMNPSGPASQTAVIVVSTPYEVKGEFAGYISVSVPRKRLGEQDAFADLPVSGLIELFTFNDTGDVLMAENSLDPALHLLPQNLDPRLFEDPMARSFRAPAASGDEYIYTLVPVSDSPLTILGVWNATRSGKTQLLQSPVPASAFPALMWIATVIVAVLALYSLVIKHISTLRGQMATFATTRQMPQMGLDPSAPSELVDIQSRFLELTDDILREEARLEAMVHEQKVMAKEVHHRVKNNLQMIASIMNMQIRNAEHTETIETLQRVQDRITSLADVHKDLYTTQNKGRINVGALIGRTVQNSIEVGVSDTDKIDLTKTIEDVWLFPDQVVPLSLLANEAITNALKYMSAPSPQKPTLTVELIFIAGHCTLRVSNSIGPDTIIGGTGIGSKLIRAFSVKLGGDVETSSDDGVYALQISFPVAEFELESRDF